MGDSVVHSALSPASRARSLFKLAILGLAPQALCCHLLRRFLATHNYPTTGLSPRHCSRKRATIVVIVAPVLLQLWVSLLTERHRYCNRTHNLVARFISASDGDRVDATTALT